MSTIRVKVLHSGELRPNFPTLRSSLLERNVSDERKKVLYRRHQNDGSAIKENVAVVDADADYDADGEEAVRVVDGGRLVQVDDFPIVGRDFDLATKLIRLNPRQAFDY